MEELDPKGRIKKWRTPESFPFVQTYQLLVLNLSSTYLMEYRLYDQAENIPTKLWTPRWLSQLDKSEACSLLAVDCCPFRVMVKSSNISYDSDECSLFYGRPLAAGEAVRECYEKLVYSNLTSQKKSQ